MDRLIYTAMTGASQTLNRQAAVAHNLANVSTAGYRAEEHRLRAVQVQSNAAQKGLPHTGLMKIVLKLLANLTDPRGGDATDRVINALAKVAPAA